tara:strand:+ start:68 stop:733 length:666 start_codon:yes stop_codon:yes gene_type:complete
MKLTNKLIGTLMALGALAMPAQAAVTLSGISTLTPTTWLPGISEGGINYQIELTSNFGFLGGPYTGGQSQNTNIDLQWFELPATGNADRPAGASDLTSMGQAQGGGLKWLGTPSAGDTLVWQGIATEDGVYAIVNTADFTNATVIAANKITLTAGQIGTWVDSDPTTNEQYAFMRVDDESNLRIVGGLVGSWGSAIVPVPEPSTTALLGLGGLALIMRRRK